MFKDLLLTLSILVRPNYWLMNQPYSPTLDKWFLENMHSQTFQPVHTYPDREHYDVYFGNPKKNVWVENHPYASFTVKFRNESYRPKRITIMKLRKKLIRELQNIVIDTESSLQEFLTKEEND